jgi:hypothetical protein
MTVGPYIVKEKITKNIPEAKVLFTNIEGSAVKGVVYNQAVVNAKGEV